MNRDHSVLERRENTRNGKCLLAPPREEKRVQSSSMTVLVIAPHCLHSGYVGCYGNRWIDTPALDRLAAEGVVFDHHFADRPDTEGARLAWTTARHHFATSPEETRSGFDLIREAHKHGVRTILIHDGEPWGDGWEDRHHTEDTLALAPQVIARLGSSDRWLVWIETSSLLPPWSVRWMEGGADGSAQDLALPEIVLAERKREFPKETNADGGEIGRACGQTNSPTEGPSSTGAVRRTSGSREKAYPACAPY